MDTLEVTMSSFVPAPDTAAPIFGRSRATNSAATYWKCHIGNRIHLAREMALGVGANNRPVLTREKLSQRLGISPKRLWEIEAGLLSIDGAEIALIAEALDIHPGWFFDDDALEAWSMTSRRTPSWLLANAIGRLSKGDRDLLETIAIRLDTPGTGERA